MQVPDGSPLPVPSVQLPTDRDDFSASIQFASNPNSASTRSMSALIAVLLSSRPRVVSTALRLLATPTHVRGRML